MRDYALSQIAPGINLLKLTILTGKRLRGRSGLIVSLLGLLVPSAAGNAATRGRQKSWFDTIIGQFPPKQQRLGATFLRAYHVRSGG